MRHCRAAIVRKAEQVGAFEALALGRADAVVFDVRDEASVASGVARAIELLGTIDVVVNNAGYGLFGAVEEISNAELLDQLMTNVVGVWNVLRAVLPHLRHNKRGHIINMSSIAGLVGSVGAGAYNASKFALEGVTEALAQEVMPLGIAVTLVEPGQFRTAFAGDSAHFAAASIDAYRGNAATMRKGFAKLSGNQPGDPVRGAAAILAIVDDPAPPVRLLLGSDALGRAGAKLAWLQSEIERSHAIAPDTAVAGAVSTLPPFVPPTLKR